MSSCAGCGWTIQRQINIACPLVLQFIGDIFSLCNSYGFMKPLLIVFRSWICFYSSYEFSIHFNDRSGPWSKFFRYCMRTCTHPWTSKKYWLHSLEQFYTVYSKCRTGVNPRSNYKRYWNWMDLCFTRRFVYLGSTINMWDYDNWTTVSHKTTKCEGLGIGSGSVMEG